jgi:hypothetical protein
MPEDRLAQRGGWPACRLWPSQVRRKPEGSSRPHAGRARRVGRGQRRPSGAVRAWVPDVLHANSLGAGLIAAPVARLFGVPLVLHVRDRLRAGPDWSSTAALSSGSTQSGSTGAWRGCALQERECSHSWASHAMKRARRIPRVPESCVIGILVRPWSSLAKRSSLRGRPRTTTEPICEVPETGSPARPERAVRFLGEHEDVPEILRLRRRAGAVPGRTLRQGRSWRRWRWVSPPWRPRRRRRRDPHHGVDGVLMRPRRPGACAAADGLLADDAEWEPMGGRPAERRSPVPLSRPRRGGRGTRWLW